MKNERKHKVLNIVKCGLLAGTILAGAAVGIEEKSNDHTESTCLIYIFLDNFMGSDGVSLGVRHLMKQINEETFNKNLDSCCYSEEYVKTVNNDPTYFVLVDGEESQIKNGKYIRYEYVDYDMMVDELFGDGYVPEEGESIQTYSLGNREINFKDYDGTKKVLKLN